MKKYFDLANDNYYMCGDTHRIRFDGSIFVINSKKDAAGRLKEFDVMASMPIKGMAKAVEREARMMSDSLKVGMTLQDCIDSQVCSYTRRLQPVEGHFTVKAASTIWDAIFQVLAKEYERPVPAYVRRDNMLAKFDGGLV